MSKNDWAVLAKLLDAVDSDCCSDMIALDDTPENIQLIEDAQILVYGEIHPLGMRRRESKIEIGTYALLRYFYEMALEKSLPLQKATGGG